MLTNTLLCGLPACLGAGRQDESSPKAVDSSAASPCLSAESPACCMDDVVTRTGLCVSEYQPTYFYDDETIRRRLRLYREAGFRTIRVETYWLSIEPEEGQIVEPVQARYFRLAKEEGFRFKLILGTLMGVPQWYFQKYPDSRMVDQNGRKATTSVSYFAPGLRGHLTDALDHMMRFMQENGLLDVTDTLVVDGGQAGEPLYPPAWTQGAGLDGPAGEEVFWGYDGYSQENFRQTVQTKYGTIAAANAAWGRSYGSFDEVEVPKPGGPGGGIWADYLTWYRDAKRQIVREQMDMYQAAVDQYTGGRVRLLQYLPGFDMRDEQWEKALLEGDGDGWVRLMPDNRYLIDLAKERGCWLQFTGFETAAETHHLREYMDASGAGDIPFFGENAGGYNVVKNCGEAFSILYTDRLAGIDVTHARFLLKEDNITPCDNFDEFRKAMERLRDYQRKGC